MRVVPPDFADNRERGYICDTYGGGMTTDVLDREDFLDSHRALAVCAREFDRLADDISKRVADLEDEAKGLKADIRRSPGRMIAQLGPVALKKSWTWRREGKTGRKAYRSAELAKVCASSINGTLRESAARRPKVRSR
jgi:hypothetical protein